MSNFSYMFQPNLIQLDVEAESEEEVFNIIGKKLKDEGMVNDGYLGGIKERESNYPTGLITQYLNVALPHSEPEFIIKPFVFVTRLKKGVIVKQMGDSQEMEVKDLFFLGIKDGKKQAGLLASFMSLFMNEEFVNQYKRSTNAKEIYELFSKNI